MKEYICPECGKPCKVIAIDESFAYSGTHCTGGRSGVHHIPVWYGSDCCEVEIEDYQEEDYDY